MENNSFLHLYLWDWDGWQDRINEISYGNLDVSLKDKNNVSSQKVNLQRIGSRILLKWVIDHFISNQIKSNSTFQNHFHDLTLTKSSSGKPELKNFFPISLTHCKTMAAVGVCSHDSSIGVDLEYFDENRNVIEIVNRFGTLNEKEKFKQLSNEKLLLEFFKLWTQKESYGKYLGIGLNSKVASTEFIEIDDFVNFKDKNHSGDQRTVFVDSLVFGDYALGVCHNIQSKSINVFKVAKEGYIFEPCNLIFKRSTNLI